AGPAPGQVQGRVGNDRVQPGADRAAALEAGQGLPGTQQRVLQGILSVVYPAEHSVAVRVQLGPVWPYEGTERAVVAASRELKRALLPTRLPICLQGKLTRSVGERGVGAVQRPGPSLGLLPVLGPAERGHVQQRVGRDGLLRASGVGRVGVEDLVAVADEAAEARHVLGLILELV